MFNFRTSCRSVRFAAAILSILFANPLFGVSQSPAPQASSTNATAGEELNLGVEAYKSSRYDDAIDHFLKAEELDPASTTAKQYLATALAQNVVPGLDTPDNLKTAQQAIDIFQQVLAKEPHDVNSMKQVAAIYFSTKKFDDARDWQKKVLDEDPKNAGAAYTIGVIDWVLAHQNVVAALTPAGLYDDGEGNAKAPPDLMAAIKAKNSALVDEALQYLNQALEDRPDYTDAMAYVNLIYRRKADVDYDNPALRDQDVAVARKWMRKSMATSKVNQEKKFATPRTEQP